MKNRILNFLDQDKELKTVNDEINNINNEIYFLKKQKNDNPFGTPFYFGDDVANLEEKLKMKKEQQSQLIDARNYFIFKFFWNIIVPILVSVIATVLINIYFK